MLYGVPGSVKRDVPIPFPPIPFPNKYFFQTGPVQKQPGQEVTWPNQAIAIQYVLIIPSEGKCEKLGLAHSAFASQTQPMIGPEGLFAARAAPVNAPCEKAKDWETTVKRRWRKWGGSREEIRTLYGRAFRNIGWN